MIHLDVEQSTQAWYEARAGIPTASNFKRILTPGGKLSAQRENYLAELLAEWACGVDIGDVYTEAMERGRVLEPEAFEYFGFHTDMEPRKCGLIYRDSDKMVAASPDALVGNDAGLEIKVPSPSKHILWLVRGLCPKEHWPQVQGQIWVAGWSHSWFMSYAPGLPPLVVRVEPDIKFQSALDALMPTFIGELVEGRKKLEEMGVRDAMSS